MTIAPSPPISYTRGRKSALTCKADVIAYTDRDLRVFVGCAGDVGHPFPARKPGKRASSGPSSNTGQKASGALIDYLTLVMPRSALAAAGVSQLDLLVESLFDVGRNELRVTPLTERRWQYYELSAYILDREGALIGRIGLGGNADSVCVSLTGDGCRYVRSWQKTFVQAGILDAKISRMDTAYDDYDGRLASVHDLRGMAVEGKFANGGRPPSSRFLSDEGSGKGSTLYVGAKGHKEFCAYEKGKEQGLPQSPWVRYEVRHYSKHSELSLEMLIRPLDYLRGAYPILAQLLTGVTERIETIRHTASNKAHAMLAWLNRQCGASLNILYQALGDEAEALIRQRVARPGLPARFAGFVRGDQLNQHIRSTLSCPLSS